MITIITFNKIVLNILIVGVFTIHKYKIKWTKKAVNESCTSFTVTAT